MPSTRSVTLIGADGTRHVLACSSEPYQLGVNAQLWGTAPYSVTARQLGAIPGERVERVRALARDVLIPIQVEGTTELEIDRRLGALGAMLSPTAELRVLYRRPDGTTRELTGRAVSGMERIQATDRSGHLQRHVRVPLVVRAHYPYWRDTATSISVAGPTTFADGMLGGSNVVDVTNTGDVDTWPELTITGLANGADLLNMTTGQVLRISERIESAQTCRIDTDPRTRSVVINDAWSWPIDALSEFWPLVPGPNRLLFRTWSDYPATTPAIGTFTIRWRANYETC